MHLNVEQVAEEVCRIPFVFSRRLALYDLRPAQPLRIARVLIPLQQRECLIRRCVDVRVATAGHEQTSERAMLARATECVCARDLIG